MTKFKEAWAKHAQDKKITASDMISYAILRAIVSKAEDKRAVALHLLHKAFSPISKPSRLANGAQPYQALLPLINNARLYKPEFLGVELTEEEFKLYNEIYTEITNKPDTMVRYYSYFFTRQDIFPEYQLVQTAHAALELGAQLQPEQVKNLHFTCCGVPNLAGLECMKIYLEETGHKFVVFHEPDIGNEMTAIGVYPIAEHKRGELRKYSLLRFSQVEKAVTIQPKLEIKEI